MSLAAVDAAYRALVEGAIDPLVALIDTQMEWRGRRRLRQPWRVPS